MICMDVATRGVDIHGVPYVINVTLPDEKQNYVHRIGRVGGAERMGMAISLVATEKEKGWYRICSSCGKAVRTQDSRKMVAVPYGTMRCSCCLRWKNI